MRGSPSTKRTPRTTSPSRDGPSSRRQRRCALRQSRKTMVSAVRRDRQPLVLVVRRRTVANVLSTGFVVLTCFQCSAGKVVEGEQRLPVPDQAGGGLVVLGAVGVDEVVEGSLGRIASLGHPDRVQVLLGLGLHVLRCWRRSRVSLGPSAWQGRQVADLPLVAGDSPPTARLAGGAIESRGDSKNRVFWADRGLVRG